MGNKPADSAKAPATTLAAGQFSGAAQSWTNRNSHKAVFFDRDGTLNVDIHYLHRPEDFVWLPDAREAIRYVNEHGYLAILITNQSGVARGYYPERDIVRVYDWMNAELGKIGAHLDDLRYCPHHPEAALPEYRQNCTCRKPQPGMVEDMCEKYALDKSQCYFVGDSDKDMECAARAGIQGLRYTGGSLLELVEKYIK